MEEVLFSKATLPAKNPVSPDPYYLLPRYTRSSCSFPPQCNVPICSYFTTPHPGPVANPSGKEENGQCVRRDREIGNTVGHPPAELTGLLGHILTCVAMTVDFKIPILGEAKMKL